MKPGPIPKKNVLTSNRFRESFNPDFVCPECPEHLHGFARKEWYRISPLLTKYRLVREIDTAALALYCSSYGRWQDAEQKLKECEDKTGNALIIKSPNGYPIQNPYLAIANKEKEATYKYLQQFCLSPASADRDNTQKVGTLDFGEDKNYFT